MMKRQPKEATTNAFLASVAKGEVEEVKKMLKSDPTLVDLDLGEESALTQARGTEMMKLLLQPGADPNRIISGKNALHHFVEEGNLDIVEVLIQYGANPNLVDSYGFSPLYKAAKNRSQNHQQIAEFLLRNGANLDLNSAVCLGMEEKVREMLASGGLLKAKFPENLLHDAILCGSTGLVELLLKSGVDPNKVGYGQPFLPLIDALSTTETDPSDSTRWLQGHAGMVRLLLDYGADPNKSLAEGVAKWKPLRSTLAYAEKQGVQPKIIEMLKQAGAS